MKRFTSLLAMALLLIAATGLTAQVTEEWLRTYHYQVNDYANAIAVDDSGNVYITGWSEHKYYSSYFEDIVTIKYEPSGIRQWVKGRYP